MKLALLIFAVTFSGAAPVPNGAVGGTGTAAGTEESRTKPVSAPLPKESMNLQAIPYKIVYETPPPDQGQGELRDVHHERGRLRTEEPDEHAERR